MSVIEHGVQTIALLMFKGLLSLLLGRKFLLVLVQFEQWNKRSWIDITGEKEYYEKQIETLKSFEEVDTVVNSDGVDDENLREQAQHERAMMISNYANIVLLAFKVTHLLVCSIPGTSVWSVNLDEDVQCSRGACRIKRSFSFLKEVIAV